MNAKVAFVICASALLTQSALGACCGRLGGCGYGCGGLGASYGGGLGASYGGGLSVASASAAPPVGLDVTSENRYEGCVGVCGELPFLGTVGVEGCFPSCGAGLVSYGCGDGCVGITGERGYVGYEGLGYGGYGLGGCGCGGGAGLGGCGCRGGYL